MIPFRRVLFPVDYSEPCRALVPYVRETIGHFSAELTLVHAYGPEALAFSELPMTGTGKIQRHVLRDVVSQRRAATNQ